jgi:hypothetical protein
MAELADAHGSGPCESDFMQVQVLLSAPYHVLEIDAHPKNRIDVRFFGTFLVKITM